MRRSLYVNSDNNYIICSPTGMIDYLGRMSKEKAEDIANRTNKILEIIPRVNKQTIVDLVWLDITGEDME